MRITREFDEWCLLRVQLLSGRITDAQFSGELDDFKKRFETRRDAFRDAILAQIDHNVDKVLSTSFAKICEIDN